METEEFGLDYMGTVIIFRIIKFGNPMFIYVGSENKSFDDLTAAMPDSSTSHLVGDGPSEELGATISKLTKVPILISYNFSLDSEFDQKRFDFVKISLAKHFTKKE